MSSKNKSAQTGTQQEIPGTPAKKKRTPAVLSPEVQGLVDKAKASIAAEKNTMKEAKSLNKIVTQIATVGVWALDQIPAAIERRREALKATSSEQGQ